jgi:hypothetical protein
LALERANEASRAARRAAESSAIDDVGPIGGEEEEEEFQRSLLKVRILLAAFCLMVEFYTKGV